MSDIERASERYVSPDDLKVGLDTLLELHGKSQTTEHGVDASATFLRVGLPDTPRRDFRVEDLSFDVLTRHSQQGAEATYRWLEILPATAVSSDRLLTFLGGTVFSSHNMYIAGWTGPEGNTTNAELSADKRQELHTIVTSPTLESRQQAIEDYYRFRHEQRSAVGRGIAKLFRRDQPRAY